MTAFTPAAGVKYIEKGWDEGDSLQLPPEGPTVGRRGIKEYRAPEALILIAADRDRHPLICPSCGSPEVERTPARESVDDAPGGRVTLHCNGCSRSAVYIDRVGAPTTPSDSLRPPRG